MSQKKILKKPNITFDDVIPDIKAELKGKVSLSIDIDSFFQGTIIREVYPDINWEIIDHYFSLLCLNFDKIECITIYRTNVGDDTSIEYEIYASVDLGEYLSTYRFYLTNPANHVTPDQYICLRQLIDEDDTKSLANFDELYQMILDNTEGLVLRDLISSISK